MANFTVHIGQISFAQNVGEIEQQIIHQTLYASDFLLGTQRLVKLNQGVNPIRRESGK